MSHEAALRYEELPPGVPLGELVECFWHAVDRVPRLGRPPEHIVPDGCPEIIVRLQAALLEIGDEQRAAGVEAALAAGYFDQSHLLRDFRGLAGRAATRPRQADGEMARHFTDPHRLLTLLGGE